MSIDQERDDKFDFLPTAKQNQMLYFHNELGHRFQHKVKKHW